MIELPDIALIVINPDILKKNVLAIPSQVSIKAPENVFKNPILEHSLLMATKMIPDVNITMLWQETTAENSMKDMMPLYFG